MDYRSVIHQNLKDKYFQKRFFICTQIYTLTMQLGQDLKQLNNPLPTFNKSQILWSYQQ